ncbi:conserved hypothetical protein (plasmid) [Gloeothece citriformis PCC 7424]|uniref:Uncharacterized protein n=1 Tax=Gloeothece citriformis (strain PCC 7424) TaxID=65393 RepID=B7KMR9_GLOC7|nr:type I-MYXAN CRISPR-associated Cas8a1/Cmx1 [Gloeothece citriformis]ACK74091.1 conserved hypothetical protein [Gloeothece citriformis PCC 7424]
MALKYRLFNPNYTICHRGAMGGLAATIKAWGDNLPEGIQAQYDAETITIDWDETLTEQEALEKILAASFKLTEDKLIDLPGQFIGEDSPDLRLVIHEALCLTFLQHNKMRPGEKTPRISPWQPVDQEDTEPITYRAINSYAHQKAQGTGLLDKAKEGEIGKFPFTATLPQSVIPGAMTGKKALQAMAEDAILLLYLMVGSVIFLLRPTTYRGKSDKKAREKAQACIVIPNVTNLKDFVDSLEILTATSKNIERFNSTYLGRIVGGAEEAALTFLSNIQADDIANSSGVSGCQVIAMGKVAWDKNQINRSLSIQLRNSYPEMTVFRAAKKYLGQSKWITAANGKRFAIPNSPVPELIAANLASERHWCAYFSDLISKKKDFQQMLFRQGGLHAMAKAVKDEDDQAIIQAFHKAWEMTMGQIGDRSREKNLDFSRLVEVKREKIRNEILRAKTASGLATWFLQFCTDATKGASLLPIRNEADRIRAFIFNARNFERFQNLLLFALLSYANDETNRNNNSEGDKN